MKLEGSWRADEGSGEEGFIFFLEMRKLGSDTSVLAAVQHQIERVFREITDLLPFN